MNNVNIAMKLYARNYTGYINLGINVLNSLTDNMNFISPSPPLSVLSADIDTVKLSLAAWNSVGKRGSPEVLFNLRKNTGKLAQTLKALSEFVLNTVQISCENNTVAMAEMVATSGFPLKSDGAPQGLFDMVSNLRTIHSAGLRNDQLHLIWSKPATAKSTRNVKFYKVYIGALGSPFSAATMLATTTKTNFIYSNRSGDIERVIFWIVAVNAAGDGAPSEGLAATIVNI